MFKISKQYRFEASHQLIHHDGKCARLHGHSWVLSVEFEGQTLQDSGPETNMLLDYGNVSKVMKPIIERLDHYHLNDVLHTDSPTSEFLAKWVKDEIFKVWDLKPPPGIRPCAISINETCTSECRLEF